MPLTLHAPPHLVREAERLTQAHPTIEGHLFATSGTTGQPKWILHSQEGLDWCADRVNEHFQCSSQDVWGLVLPEFHVGGYCLTHRAKRAGGTLSSFLEKWNATGFVKWARKHDITIVSLVPTQVFDIVQSQLQCPENLRLAIIGGDRLEIGLYQKAKNLGWPLIVSYGMTETAGMIAISYPESPDLAPLAGWNLTSNEEGLLEISGPGLFKGLLTEEKLTPSSEHFTTTDLVELSNEQLTITGRVDDQIKILGELVDLQRLKNDLAALLPEIPTTVIAQVDERRGHALTPVLEGFFDKQTHERILEWRTKLPPFCQLQDPVFITNWPLTDLGKVNRIALAKLLP